jgi:hypothetical protein
MKMCWRHNPAQRYNSFSRSPFNVSMSLYSYITFLMIWNYVPICWDIC